MTHHDVPPERDLPAGRLVTMKDDLMAQIEHDIEDQDRTRRRSAPPTSRPRPRRMGLGAAAAALVVGLAVTGVLAVRGDDSASAGPNFAASTDDGFVRIHIEDLGDPGKVERDLAALGVPAVVDIHEGGGRRCDPSRSDGWTAGNPGLFPAAWDDVPDDDMFDFRIDPDALRPGETVALEFFWDEHDGAWVTMTSFRTSLSPIGECEIVDDDAVVVDAEQQVVGG